MKDIERSFKIKLSPQEEFQLVVGFVKKNVKITQIIIKNVSKEEPINCPFPFECNNFPCEDLSCNADRCSNGYAYRMNVLGD